MDLDAAIAWLPTLHSPTEMQLRRGSSRHPQRRGDRSFGIEHTGVRLEQTDFIALHLQHRKTFSNLVPAQPFQRQIVLRRRRLRSGYDFALLASNREHSRYSK